MECLWFGFDNTKKKKTSERVLSVIHSCEHHNIEIRIGLRMVVSGTLRAPPKATMPGPLKRPPEEVRCPLALEADSFLIGRLDHSPQALEPGSSALQSRGGRWARPHPRWALRPERPVTAPASHPQTPNALVSESRGTARTPEGTPRQSEGASSRPSRPRHCPKRRILAPQQRQNLWQDLEDFSRLPPSPQLSGRPRVRGWLLARRRPARGRGHRGAPARRGPRQPGRARSCPTGRGGGCGAVSQVLLGRL